MKRIKYQEKGGMENVAENKKSRKRRHRKLREYIFLEKKRYRMMK